MMAQCWTHIQILHQQIRQLKCIVVYLNSSCLVVDRGLEHLEQRAHDRVRDEWSVLSFDLAENALKERSEFQSGT